MILRSFATLDPTLAHTLDYALAAALDYALASRT
jgi:hypothetical protein